MVGRPRSETKLTAGMAAIQWREGRVCLVFGHVGCWGKQHECCYGCTTSQWVGTAVLSPTLRTIIPTICVRGIKHVRRDPVLLV